MQNSWGGGRSVAILQPFRTLSLFFFSVVCTDGLANPSFLFALIGKEIQWPGAHSPSGV